MPKSKPKEISFLNFYKDPNLEKLYRINTYSKMKIIIFIATILIAALGIGNAYYLWMSSEHVPLTFWFYTVGYIITVILSAIGIKNYVVYIVGGFFFQIFILAFYLGFMLRYPQIWLRIAFILLQIIMVSCFQVSYQIANTVIVLSGLTAIGVITCYFQRHLTNLDMANAVFGYFRSILGFLIFTYCFTRINKKNFLKKMKHKMANQEFQRIFKEIPVGVVITKESKPLFYNESACESLTANSNDIYECFQQFLNSVSQGDGAHPIAFNNRCLRLRSMPTSIFSLGAILYIIDDVTKIKEIEQEKMKSRYKTLFLGRVTHELNQPCASATLMLREMKPIIPQSHWTYFLNCMACLELLQNLIYDILDFAKIEEKKLSLNQEIFNPKSACMEVISIVAFQAEHSGISIIQKYDPSCEGAFGDKRRTKQVILNLLSNALKFTPRGGHIIVSVFLNDLTVWISVEDNGKGIKEENLPKLFKEFGMIEGAENTNGNGLGLSICKDIVQSMGGQIKVDSQFNKGSIFKFSLKHIVAQNDEVQEELVSVSVPKISIVSLGSRFTPHKMGNVNNKVALVVDDNAIGMMAVSAILRRMNVKVYQASNGLEAIECLKQHNEIQLVLSDLEMPVMNGYSASKEMKQVKRQIRVIGMSAYVSQEILERVRACGMEDIIAKPISEKQLGDLINSINGACK